MVDERFLPYPLLILGILLASGALAGAVASRFGLPRVAAYVAAGMLFSPSLLGGFLGIQVREWAEIFTTAALGIIAYIIGGSITVNQLQRTGVIIIASTVGESLGAVLFVFAAILALAPAIAGLSTPMIAFALAAIAATTAPAGTVAVLHQYRARGPLSSTLLGVVALDDAVGIILFALMLVIAVGESLTVSLAMAVTMIGGALTLGVLGGWTLAGIGRHVGQDGLRLPMIIGTVLWVVGLAEVCGLSALLAAMSLGFSVRVFSRDGGDRFLAPVEYIEETVFVVFFTLAGIHFRYGVFVEQLSLIATYFLARIAGKMSGAAVGAWIAGAPKTVVRWLGLGLVPQAGVAVGLALSLSHQPTFQESGIVIVNTILGITLLYEVIGPLATRFALDRAGEISKPKQNIDAST